MRSSTAALFASLLVLVIIFASLTPAPRANAEPLFQGDTTDGGILLGEMPRLDNYTIYFTEGAGEASRFDRSDFGMSRLAGLLNRLGAQLLTLDWNRDVPDDAGMIIIAGPLESLRADQYARLWTYVKRGGRLLLLVEPLAPQLDNNVLRYSLNEALGSNDGFFQLTWADLGIRARNEVVVIGGEPETVRPFPDQPRSGEPTPTPLPMVESIPLTTEFSTTALNTTHPITAGIEGELTFFGARPVEFDSSIQLFDTQVLVFSGAEAYGESNYGLYLQRGVAQYNVGEDLAQGPQALVAVVENNSGTRVILIGDRDFITNGGGFQTSPPSTAGFIHPNDVRFILNSIVWLLEAESEEQVEFTFPTPGPTATMTLTPTQTPYMSPTPTSTPTMEVTGQTESG